jgi:ketosteroid isomerase-like protein
MHEVSKVQEGVFQEAVLTVPIGERMLIEANEALIEQYRQIVKTDDIDRFSTLITDDCTWTLHPTGYTFNGSAQVMAFAKIAGGTRIHDDAHRVEITNLFTDGVNLCVEYDHGFILAGLRLKGSIRICLVFHMRHGKFDRVNEYIDIGRSAWLTFVAVAGLQFLTWRVKRKFVHT